MAMGVYAAHGLEGEAQERARHWVETGAQYQMLHTLALLSVAVLCDRAPDAVQPWLAAAGWAFLIGIVFFSGGLYKMALTGWPSLGPVVPLGGLAFFAGWAALLVAGLRYSPGAGSRSS